MRSPPRLFLLRSRAPWVCKTCRANFSSTIARTAKDKKIYLPDAPARTRFAPSPTGYLHLGSLRTALFNYLLAKRTGGQFLLRIEDTDQKRTVPDAEKRLYEDLQWAGLQWDEGPVVGGPYGPYRQSERTSLYAAEAQNLIKSGHAYRCFCSPERLDTLARHRNELGLPAGYDGTCTGLSAVESEERAAKAETHVVRLRVTEPYPMFNDLVFGKTGQNKAAQGGVQKSENMNTYVDPILLKSDGHPTYHLANVVDDHYMKITHVIRGTEWMSSTPMHVALYKAFQWQPPKFGHVTLLVDENGQKLSKRNADIDIASYRNQGVLPDTLVNFSALLGWSHTHKSDIMTMKEIEERFNLKLTKGNVTVAFEKMWYLQKAHAQRSAKEGSSTFDNIVDQITELAEKTYPAEQLTSILKSRTLNLYIASILTHTARTYTTPAAFLSQNAAFFTPTIARPPYTPTTQSSASQPQSSNNNIPLPTLHTAAAALSLVPPTHWTATMHTQNINAFTSSSLPTDQDQGLKQSTTTFKKELYNYLRWALVGGSHGPGIPATMGILGREECVRRFGEARGLTGGEEWVEGKGVKGRGKIGGTRVEKKKEEGEGDEWMGSLAPKKKEKV
ncbi:glutamate-tRNA ligase [Polytolypa hystricis UAMH7299]|uniref:Glutamate--tRNA ligase, mitochondrial n=1 Tax=Polytolypa hystricis (strain UAMH7299) TaxID=1447883 RepID=A0A2B7X644_POLH7|nr:glutamate-tRNA ligase [Polytolypa hystricis UAMH7299]